jgi:hypothetical protein
VIRGDSAGGALKQTGVAPLVCVGDTLTVGPSDAAPKRHARLRERFWRTEYARVDHDWSIEDNTGLDLTLLGTNELVTRILDDARGRITLWASGAWGDLLFLGWAIAGFRRERIALDSVLLASVLTQTAPLGWANPVQLKPIGAAARPLRSEQERALRSLWDAFTFPDPSRIEQLRREPPGSLPTLPRGLALYAAFLPRKQRGRSLRLSAIDEALLASLSVHEFRRLPDMLRTPPSRARWPTSALFAMLSHFGEVFIDARLAVWAERRDPAVEAHVFREDTNVRYRTSWRLTRRGLDLLALGASSPGELPRFAIGGYRSHAEPWVCVMAGHTWRLEQLV